ncbi:MAG TPA: hypothetical protein VGO59_14155 [Verrucomicrobiae bacterium]|jgi:ppGpp synthetase/RelA/SpoT-type nucleotidyltranferase
MPVNINEEIPRQIKAYRAQFSRYKTYAKAFDRVLKRACAASIPTAVVQTRPKSISSFAEKAARKFETAKNPIQDFKDLCGARVVVQTLSDVFAVRQFIGANFEVVENEDISLRLGDDQFGYRDRHYIVRLKPDLAAKIGFHCAEISEIGNRRAEVQIRTWVQHAWADTLHDRTYKPALKLSSEASRTTALLAALMEDGDRQFDRLTSELDNRAVNYAAYAGKEKVQKELETQRTIYANEPDKRNKPALGLQIARLLGALGEHDKAIRLLEKHPHERPPLGEKIELELGTAYCRANRAKPTSDEYRHGCELIKRVVERLEHQDPESVSNLRELNALRARADFRAGWSLEPYDDRTSEARGHFRKAFECEPGNPYFLAEVLGFELRCSPGSEIVASMKTVIQSAVNVCAGHAADKIELPRSSFMAGRMRLLLGDNENALNDYLLGAAKCLDGQGCDGCELVDAEIAWLYRVNYGKPLPEEFEQAKNLLLLTKKAHDCACGGPAPAGLPSVRAKINRPVLIAAGGAASLDPVMRAIARAPLAEALRSFKGTVISGGTTAGIPGLMGEIAAKLKRGKAKTFRLVGYHPEQPPKGAEEDDRYDEIITAGRLKFSAEQILANWVDVLGAGIEPKAVRLIGIGGGSISAVEYRVALVLGATVAVVADSGGAADALLRDPLWKDFPNLLPLPRDAASIRAFIVDPESKLPKAKVEKMARALHERYVASNKHKIPKNLQAWKELDATYVNANFKQAAYAIRILEGAGFKVREAKGKPKAKIVFTKHEIEIMAELEHGRWNVERLQDGWRPGPAKNEQKRINQYIAAWTDKLRLPDDIKKYDRDAVALFPAILAEAGLEVFRR